MKKVIALILATCCVIALAGCGAQPQQTPDEPENAPVSVNPATSGTNIDNTPQKKPEQQTPQQTEREDDGSVLEKIAVVAKQTQDGTFCVFITNGSETVIDELDIQIHYKNEQGAIIDMDEDGHDMILPGYTVVSRMDVPDSYTDFETDVSIELGVNPRYENHSDNVDISANQGEDCVIVQITNNADVDIDEVEYVVVLYDGDDIADVCYPQDVTDVKRGDTVVEKESTYGVEYDRFEVYLNQAHTFGF